MSKYNSLWDYVQSQNKTSFKLSFNEIENILGSKIDHSFLTYKKELLAFGYQVDKISLKTQMISFKKVETDER